MVAEVMLVTGELSTIGVTIAALRQGKLQRRTRRRHEGTQRRFAAWAAASNLIAMPATEQTIIRWLQTQIHTLKPLTMSTYADDIRGAHLLAGHSRFSPYGEKS